MTNLSTNFTLDEFTRTDRAEFQEENRILDDAQVATLTALANLAEEVRSILSQEFQMDAKMIVHSAYRCAPLNAAIGSVPTSQHPLCQALDFVTDTSLIPLDQAFRAVWKKVVAGELLIGQLIYETADRYAGAASWIHVSLGSPWRDQHRCQQVLRMEHGAYELLGKP